MIVQKGIKDELRWFYEARFGMFVHFGLYAMIGRGEWVMYHEDIPRDDYARLARDFNPSRFNAEEWVKLAEDAGAKYITVTAKHHDGFCLFDSALTEFKITNTPFGRDLIGELIAACQRRGMRIILYYSQPDWSHPNYVNKRGAFKDLPCPPESDRPDWPAYVRYYMGQVEELCTKYGRIDGIFFDGSHKTVEEWKGREVYDLIKKYQPHAVVNDRARYGDYFTPERTLPEDLTGYMFEACESISPVAWGYKPDSSSYSVPHLVKSLVKMAAAGGNYLLNVGPAPDGMIPAKQAEVMRGIGKWMKARGQSVYGTDPLMLDMPKVKIRRNKFVKLDDGTAVLKPETAIVDFASLKGRYGYTAVRSAGGAGGAGGPGGRNAIYFLCMEWPESDRLILPGILTKVKNVSLLGNKGYCGNAADSTDNSTDNNADIDADYIKIKFRQDEYGVELLDLPCDPADALVQVFELKFDEPPAVLEKVKAESAIITVAVDPEGDTQLKAETARFEGYGVKGTKLIIGAMAVPGAITAGAAAGTGGRNPEPSAQGAVKAAMSPELQVKYISGWWVPEQKAVWRVVCEKEGSYDVYISAGCSETEKGAVILIEAGGQKLTADMPVIPVNASKAAKAPEAAAEEDSLLEGSVLSDAGFEIVKAGNIRLPSGMSDISVSPAKLKWGYIFGKVEKLVLRVR